MKRKVTSLLTAALLVLTSMAPLGTANAEESHINPVPELEVSGKSWEDLEDLFDQITDTNDSVMEDLGKKDWEKLAESVKKTKSWRENLVAVAQSQVGYREEKGGMTLYTRWAGYETAQDWTALFVNWVAEKAGLTEKEFPRGNSYEELKAKMNSAGALKKVSRTSYPAAGDLALMEIKGQELVAVVVYVNNDWATVITGDNQGEVTSGTYRVKEIKSYVDLTVLMERAGINVGKSDEAPEIPEGGVAGRTTGSAVYMRSEPTTASKRVTTVKKAGTQILVTSAQQPGDGYVWYGVKYGKYEGYIRGDLVKLDKAELNQGSKPSQELPGMQERVVNIEVIEGTNGQEIKITFEIYGAISFEWHEIKTTASGETTDSVIATTTDNYVTVTAQSGDAYSYYCIATIVANGTRVNVTSKPTVLSVVNDGTVTASPITAEAILGEEVNFTYTIENANRYQWFRKYKGLDEALTNETNAKLTFYATAEFAGAEYYCIAILNNGKSAISATYTYTIKDKATLTNDDLLKYVDELAHMSATNRFKALAITWAIEVDGTTTLSDKVIAYYKANCQATYPHLLCSCDTMLSPSSSSHDEDCPWYQFVTTGYGTYYNCSEFPEVCEVISNWQARNASMMEIYRYLNALSYDDIVNFVWHAAAAHDSFATTHLCSCSVAWNAEDYDSYILTAPGAAHDTNCPWYMSDAAAQQAARELVDPEFAAWADLPTTTAEMIARALQVPTLDHLVAEVGSDGVTYIYVARDAAYIAYVDENGQLIDSRYHIPVAEFVSDYKLVVTLATDTTASE